MKENILSLDLTCIMYCFSIPEKVGGLGTINKEVGKTNISESYILQVFRPWVLVGAPGIGAVRRGMLAMNLEHFILFSLD